MRVRRAMQSVTGVMHRFFFFFQAEDGIRDLTVTGVQTCALPIWREVPVADLIQTNCPLEVFQSMEAEIDGRYAVEEGDGRRGGDDLATVPERGDPGGAVDVYPDVALSAHDRRSGVQPYSDSDRTGGEGVQAGARLRD